MIQSLKYNFLVILILFSSGLIAQPLIIKDTLLAKNDSVTTVVIQKSDVQQAETETDEINPQELTSVISGKKILWTIIVLAFGYLVIALVLGLMNSYALRNPKSSLAIKRIMPIIRIIAWTFILYIIIVGVFDPPAATLFAFFASIGVAIGFAAQDLLKNVFGGLLVMFDRPFQIGDKIEAGGHYGEVIAIGIRSTKIVTPDDSVITIPNSDFMSSFVSNSNAGENNCQVVAEIYLPLDIDTERVRKIATEAALISKYIYLNKPIVVLFFNEIHEMRSVYKMRLKAYVSDLSKEFAFKSEMTEIVIKTLIEEKILLSDNLIN
ncbi:MAG: mechanosensitive ion channel domain-containing protein [Bacteroidota bacterium]|jgi:small-conductance mechanosensitive channel